MDLFAITYFPVLLISLAVVFAIREVATFKGIIPVKYIVTPLVTGLTAGFVILSVFVHGIDRYRCLILAALILSLVADTMLMITEVDLIKYGIGYFLAANILYISAFAMEHTFRTWNILPAALLILFVVFFYIKIKGKTSGLDVPILVYAIVVFIMLFFAISQMDLEFRRKSIFIFSGAILFVISDLVLVYFIFIRPYKHESVINWAFYCPAQLMIALSCFN